MCFFFVTHCIPRLMCEWLLESTMSLMIISGLLFSIHFVTGIVKMKTFREMANVDQATEVKKYLVSIEQF